MALNSQTARTQPKREQSPTPSPHPQPDLASLAGPPARVPQQPPYEDMVVDHVETRPVAQPDPVPVVTFGDDGSITIN